MGFEDEKTEQTASLFGKFEEAHETMKEADLMLKKLLVANENACLEAEKWKQTSEKMRIERDSLAAEVERMREVIAADVEQDQFLRDDINAATIEMSILMASFQENFQTMDYTISELNEMHSTILSSIKEMQECVLSSKSWLKSFSSEITQKVLPLSFPNWHHQGSLDEVASLELVHNLDSSSRGDSSTVPRDRGNGFLHVSNSLGSMKEDVEGIEPHVKGELSGFGVPQEVLNLSPGSHANFVINADSICCESQIALCALKCPLLAELEKEETDIIGHLKFSEGHIGDLIEENDKNDNVTHTLALSQEPDQNDVLFRNELYGHELGSVALENVIKDSKKESTGSLGQVQCELAIKIAEVDAMLCRKREIVTPVRGTAAALASSRSEPMENKDLLITFLKEKNSLNGQLKTMDAERQLKHQEKVIESLEKEIYRMNASLEERRFSSVQEILQELRSVCDERDRLQDDILHLNEKLEMARAMADENEAVAVEARQVCIQTYSHLFFHLILGAFDMPEPNPAFFQDAEASRIHAEEKEEEIRVLESSVAELEGTIDMLEKKVTTGTSCPSLFSIV